MKSLIAICFLLPSLALASSEIVRLSVEGVVDVCDASVRTSKFGLCKPTSTAAHEIQIELMERHDGKELSGFWSNSLVVEGVTFRNDISIFKRKTDNPKTTYLVAISLISTVGKSLSGSKETNEFITLASMDQLNEIEFEGSEVSSHKKILTPSFSVSPVSTIPVKK
jgi:hypothetical protein